MQVLKVALPIVVCVWLCMVVLLWQQVECLFNNHTV